MIWTALSTPMSNYLRGHLSQALADRTGKVKVIIGTFSDWVRYAREQVHFKPEDYVIINVEINY